jgi:predicted TIM-barrel fold metal-dependent hydrolase
MQAMSIDSHPHLYAKLKRKAANQDLVDVTDNLYSQKRFFSEKIAHELGFSLKISPSTSPVNSPKQW